MAREFGIGGSFNVTTGNNGDTIILGDVDYGTMGAFHVHFADAADSGGQAFSGSLTVVTRSASQQAAGDGVRWVETPYRPIFLNGVKRADFNPTNVPLTTTSVILVPSSGGAIALQVTCGSGSGKLYVMPTTGESAVG